MTDTSLLPSYAGPQTFLRAPSTDIANLDKTCIAIYGAPFEASTRSGQRFGPRILREQSIHFQYYLASDPNAELVDVDAERVLRKQAGKHVYDMGDVATYPLDAAKTVASIAAMSQAITAAGALPIMLGGDHMTTIGAFRGFHDAIRAKNPNAKVGYIHLDAHFDLGDDNPVYGKLNAATVTRRIMEMDGVDPRNISIIGIRGIARKSQVDLTRDAGMNYYPMPVVRRRGLEAVVRDAADRALDGCDAVYVTFDIDYVDVIHAPGNGGIMFDGMTNAEGLKTVQILSEYPGIRAFDMVEVNQSYDVSDITAKFGAQAIFKFMMPRLFDISPL